MSRLLFIATIIFCLAASCQAIDILRSRNRNSVSSSKASTDDIALLIIDPQVDFVNGSMGIPGSDVIFPVINNKLRTIPFRLTVISQDWHPARHVSFASRHRLPDGTNPPTGKPFTLPDGKVQVVWPDHCLQNSNGAKIVDALPVRPDDVYVKKGMNLNIDSYSAFYDNDGTSQTEMNATLGRAAIRRVVLCGLAFDYCVGWSALDAKKLGYDVYVVSDASKSIAPASEAAMITQLQEKGIQVITADKAIELFKPSATATAPTASPTRAPTPAPTASRTPAPTPLPL